MVYGKTLINAQQYLIKSIPVNSNMLIVGGGTGWVLEEITKTHPSGLKITYIDASEKMIAIAQKRNIGKNEVKFISLPIENVVIEGVYDVVLTPFFFDNFTDDSLHKIVSSISMHVTDNGIWLYCDFQNTNVLWQKVLLKIMYYFFRISCGIEARHLPDASGCFAQHNYKVMEQKIFLHGFISSKVYNK